MIDVTAAAEATLCRIITDVLGVDRVGPEDGFFEAGGDSVLAVQVVARVREAGLDLTVRDLFDHQTPAALAVVIGALPPDAAGAGATEASGDPAGLPDSPLVDFADDEFGEFEAVDAGQDGAGTEAEWETIT
ncbi:phosphopantetheine-binding protein [Spirillospora sp. NPDC047279]|uniref:phosphopantetheine-binding protein n=1 Tax=Spirillospora sp. NPDC047279 TaxID=3155478 RepID=UPI0033D5EB71